MLVSPLPPSGPSPRERNGAEPPRGHRGGHARGHRGSARGTGRRIAQGSAYTTVGRPRVGRGVSLRATR
ncbi:hypothetical protein DSY14_15330 [Nocardiopsis sp. MG754419]|nr:hypothetical protein [Nocardiopsis sp. MG754419]